MQLGKLDVSQDHQEDSCKTDPSAHQSHQRVTGVKQNETAFPIVIAEWTKSNETVVRVALDKFKGHTYINARVWYTAADGELRPSKNGIGLSVRHLPDLIRSYQDALERARELGLIDGGAE